MNKTARQLLPSSSFTRQAEPDNDILLFGEVLVDCFPDREVQGGAPFNVARHLLGLGGLAGLNPMLVTRIGKDERGRRLLETFRSLGLAMDGVQQDLLHPTGQVQITLESDSAIPAHRFEISRDQAWDFIHADVTRLIGMLYSPKWVYYGTLSQRGNSRLALRELLHTTRARSFLDINLRDPWVRLDVLRWSLRKAEIVKMNEEELYRLALLFELGGGSPQHLGERLIQAFDLRQLLVTQGEAGAWLLGYDGDYRHSGTATPVTDLVDSVGAGDAFAAVFLLGLIQDWPIELTLDRAHRFAGEICRLRGAIPENPDFYQPFIAEWRLTSPSPNRTGAVAGRAGHLTRGKTL